MARNRRRFNRPLGKRRYEKLFVVAPEGTKTEPQYFSLFRQWSSTVVVQVLPPKRHHSAPRQVLNELEKQLRHMALRKGDEVWIVLDKDHWSEDQLADVYHWCTSQANRGLAVSNPNFEYWLLLHFEEGYHVGSAAECIRRLKRYIPNYDKNIDRHSITTEMICDAVRRGKQRDCPPCEDWPRALGSTTVYRLVERILREIERRDSSRNHDPV